MKLIPLSKDMFSQIENGPAKTARARKKMTFYTDTTLDHSAYNVSLDYMVETAVTTTGKFNIF